MRNRGLRRLLTKKKMKQRGKILDAVYSACWYYRKSPKLEKSLGYIKDGHNCRLGLGGYSRKSKMTSRFRNLSPNWTRSRTYGYTYNYKPHDKRQILRVIDYDDKAIMEKCRRY